MHMGVSMPSAKQFERSIIQVGDSALAITLPSWWARANGLKPRMRLTLEVMADGSLRVTPRREKARGHLISLIKVSGKRAEGSIVREVVASYLAGFTRIRIEYEHEAYNRILGLRRILEDVMLGLALVEEGAGYMEYYVTVDTGTIGFWEAVDKAFKATLSMMRITIDSARRRDVEALRAIPDRDTLVDRLYLYASRKINMVLLGLEPFQSLGLVALAEAPTLAMAVKSIERVADHTVLIARNTASILTGGKQIPEGVLEMVNNSYRVFETSGKALLGRSKRAADEVAEIIDKYPSRVIPSPTTSIPEAALIIDSARRILGYSLDLAEIVFDLNSVRLAMEQASHGKSINADLKG